MLFSFYGERDAHQKGFTPMNVFDKAKAAPTASKGKGKPAIEVEISGLEEFAAIDAVMKALKGLRETLEIEVKQAQKKHFVAEGVRTKKRPANFKAFQGIAKASCELRARSSASALSEDEQALLKEHNIPMKKLDAVADTFIINPAYIGDSALLERVGSAIAKVKGVPEDFIQKQVGKSSVVVEEGALDKLFEIGDENVCSTLLSLVGTLAIKPTVGDSMTEALAIVQGVLFPQTKGKAKAA